jgi:hypothetical protein
VEVKGGELRIDFPEVKAGQAILSAIAIASKTPVAFTAAPKQSDWSWAAAEKEVIAKMPTELLPEDKNARASVTYEAEAAQVKGKYVKKEWKKQEGIFFGKGKQNSIQWTISTGLAQVYALRFKFMNLSGTPMPVRLQLIAPNGSVLKDDLVTFPDTPEKWRLMSTTTGGYINAGTYKVILSAENMEQLAFDALDVQ